MPGQRDLPRGVAPAGVGAYTKADAVWYTDKAAARAMVDELKPPA